MKMTLHTGWLLAAVVCVACGDETSGDGTGGAGGESTTSGTTKATTATGGPATTTTGGGTTTASTTASSTSASTTGAGGAPEGHCANAVSCTDGANYFCDEISGPNAAFEQECAQEGGTFAQGPCLLDQTACVFDCVTPSVYSIFDVGQVECEAQGGTYIADP
jgi:hypothetical protein